MSGFSYPNPSYSSLTYNPAFYAGLDGEFLTLEYANILYLSKNDYRISYLNGISEGIGGESKVMILDASKNIIGINNLSATNLTGTIQTAAQPNITSLGTLSTLSTGSISLGGTDVISTANQINYLNVAQGTAEASKALVLDSSKNITGINNLNVLESISINGVNISGSLSSSSNYLSGITVGTAASLKAIVLDS